MPNEADYLDITLLGKEYRVACSQEERADLLAAVAYVDEKMREIAEKTRSKNAERIAVMAALNISHELLQQNRLPDGDLFPETHLEIGVDIDAVKRRILLMEAQLDEIISPQNEAI